MGAFASLGQQNIPDSALLEREELFRRVFESAGVGMALARPTGKLIQVNQALCRFLGYSTEELMSRDIHCINHPENVPTSQALLAQLMSREFEQGEFERRYLREDGSTVWAWVTISTTRNVDGDLTCIIAQFKDITQRKLTEEALQRSEAFVRALTENATDLIMVVSPEHTWKYVSPSFLSSLGYSANDLLGADARPFIHADDLLKFQQASIVLMSSGKTDTLTLRFRHRDSTWRHMETNAAVLRTSTGAAEGILLMARNIEERMRAEQEIQTAHAEIELFLKSIPSVLIGLDGNGCITHWNLSAAKVLGLVSVQVLGQRIDTCGVKWLHPEMTSEVDRWLQTETSYRCDDLGYERDGRRRSLGLNIGRVSAQGEAKLQFIITGADVTERKALENQLRQAQKLEAIGQLAAGIAHEINTPTQYVGDNTRFLKDSWESLAKLLDLIPALRQSAGDGIVSREMLDQFDQAAEACDLEYLLKEVPHAIEQSLEGLQRVSKIVRGMKEFSHPGSEEKHAIDINKAIETTITVARHEWKYVAEVATEFALDLPLVPCLVGEFNQVILNLIINAAHAIAARYEGTSDKGVITIATRHDGPWAEITVQDTGTGIPEEIRSRVFEPFFTTKPVGKGTGQGLALAHSVVVKRHQGQLWFETEAGRGTKFHIRLPLELTPAAS